MTRFAWEDGGKAARKSRKASALGCFEKVLVRGACRCVVPQLALLLRALTRAKNAFLLSLSFTASHRPDFRDITHTLTLSPCHTYKETSMAIAPLTED